MEIEIFNRYCAACLLLRGVPLVRVLAGANGWQRFVFYDADGQGLEAVRAWGKGTALVNAAAFVKAIQSLKGMKTYNGPTMAAQGEENGSAAN